MYLTVAFDALLAPYEGLQVKSRVADILRKSSRSLDNPDYSPCSEVEVSTILTRRDFAPATPSITDDSVLGFAIKSALLKILDRKPSDPKYIHAVLAEDLALFGTKYEKEVRGFGVGFTQWLRAPEKEKTSQGNGVLMRMQPILDLPFLHPARIPLAKIQAEVTHGESAVQAAVLFEEIHRKVGVFKSIQARESYLIACAESLLDTTNLVTLRERKIFEGDALKILGLACLLAAHCLSWDDLFDLIAWLGGDTDTLGVVSAQLAARLLGSFKHAKELARKALAPHPELLRLCEQPTGL